MQVSKVISSCFRSPTFWYFALVLQIRSSVAFSISATVNLSREKLETIPSGRIFVDYKRTWCHTELISFTKWRAVLQNQNLFVYIKLEIYGAHCMEFTYLYCRTFVEMVKKLVITLFVSLFIQRVNFMHIIQIKKSVKFAFSAIRTRSFIVKQN